MKRIVLIGGLLLTLFLAVACGGSAELATVEPQAELQSEPAAAVTKVEEELPEVAVGEVAVGEVAVGEVAVEEVVVEEAAVEEVAVEEAEAVAEATEPAEVVEMAEVVSTTDYDLIGQTGRPQFLNSYANW